MLTKQSLLKAPKAVQSAYIQLKTGIGLQKAYLARIGKALNEKYGCGKTQDTTYLVLYCKKYKKQRKTLKEALRGLLLNL